MRKTRVIEFEPRERILQKAKNYIESVELFLDESEQAIPLLLKALKYADRNLKREIMLFLGSFAKEESVWPLYDLMTDPSEDEEVRRDASIQLSVIGPLLKDPQPLLDRLLQELERPDAERRQNATFGLGWRGNSQAAIPLIQRLYDPDERVQQAAVNALCNLKDDRILDLLVDRLNQGSLDQKRAILLNLWRFREKESEVVNVYLRYLEHDHPDLRFDALVCMGPVTQAEDHLEAYRKCLKDKDARVRELALKRLAEEAGATSLESLRAEIEPLLNDLHMKVKKAALEILKRVK
jgi:HEAT repeat protein